MEQILRLIEHSGYLVVFFGVMLESTGVPVPGETILLASGLLAQQGHLDVATPSCSASSGRSRATS
jgi:membrane protein DedA with SNARE-associated domain